MTLALQEIGLMLIVRRLELKAVERDRDAVSPREPGSRGGAGPGCPCATPITMTCSLLQVLVPQSGFAEFCIWSCHGAGPGQGKKKKILSVKHQ